jgi:hypothetical protein
MSPLTDQVRHRVIGSAIYELPWLRDRGDVLGAALGGWQVSGVISIRSGEPMRINQASGIGNSRPDYNGGNQVFDDWRDTLQYLDRSAYPLVPTIRSRAQPCGQARRTPLSWKRQAAVAST